MIPKIIIIKLLSLSLMVQTVDLTQIDISFCQFPSLQSVGDLGLSHLGFLIHMYDSSC